MNTNPVSRLHLWFWANYWWNRVFCLFDHHIDRPLPKEFADKWEEPENTGRLVCVVCHAFAPEGE